MWLELTGEIGVSRGDRCQNGRLVLAGEDGVIKGDWWYPKGRGILYFMLVDM